MKDDQAATMMSCSFCLGPTAYVLHLCAILVHPIVLVILPLTHSRTRDIQQGPPNASQVQSTNVNIHQIIIISDI